jgi:hypothetical protein
MATGTQKTSIVRAAIHPSIGVARLGNSMNEFFLAPEVPEPAPQPPGHYRDPSGALKRQAARFRIYGLNAKGEAVAELTAANAKINWTVHLANKKAAWYQFQIALDIPEANSAPLSLLRNAAVGDRKLLAIDPGPRHITGKNTKGGASHTFDTGAFMGEQVYLGELRTDEEGRLIVLGGRGKSASYNGARAMTFANNDGWHDDTADGPVTAKVIYQGKELKVEPAWAVVCPPNYAPLVKSVRTMWDLMRDLAISAKLPKAPGVPPLQAPRRPSFQNDIRPLFERLAHLEWVNAGYAAAFGWKGPLHFTDQQWLARLASRSPALKEVRLSLANQFRVFDRDSWSPMPWPWQYGDAMNVPPAHTPRQNVAVSDTQLNMLQQWADGDFVPDYPPQKGPPRNLEAVPLAEQPDTLDRASLEFCLADAFHPGCEMTWPMRQPSLYMAPFRILHAAPGWIEPDYGPQLSLDMIPPPANHPFLGQVPGGITRWMAVPWQTDTASCRYAYGNSYDPNLPTFWPARVPNQVLDEPHYKIVMDRKQSLNKRMAAFATRAAWTRPLGSKDIKTSQGYLNQINNMMERFGEMGVVEHRDGPGDEHFPATMQVQNLPAHTRQRLETEQEPLTASDEVDLSGIEKVRRFPRGLKK